MLGQGITERSAKQGHERESDMTGERGDGTGLSARYEIRVRGELGTAWSDWFAGPVVTGRDGGDTVMIGDLDRAAPPCGAPPDPRPRPAPDLHAPDRARPGSADGTHRNAGG